MKASSMLLVAMGMASSAAWAQTGYPATIPATTPPASQAPAAGTERTTGGSDAAQSSGAETADRFDSSGAPAQDSGQTGSSGQLITPSIAQSRPAARMSSAPVQQRSEGEVTYLCGGIGDEETSYMKQAASSGYDLMMTFAAQSGSYLANVAVKIADARGNTVLNTTCDGPLMLVDLPRAGSYRVQADVNGHKINRNVAVGAKSQASRVVFAWPRNAISSDSVAGTGQVDNRSESSGANEMGGASSRSGNSMQRRPGDSGATGSSGGNGNGMNGAGGNGGEPASSGNAESSNGGARYDSPTRGVR